MGLILLVLLVQLFFKWRRASYRKKQNLRFFLSGVAKENEMGPH